MAEEEVSCEEVLHRHHQARFYLGDVFVRGSVRKRHFGLVLLDPIILGVVYEEKLDKGDVRPLLLTCNILPIYSISSRSLVRADGLWIARSPPQSDGAHTLNGRFKFGYTLANASADASSCSKTVGRKE